MTILQRQRPWTLRAWNPGLFSAQSLAYDDEAKRRLGLEEPKCFSEMQKRRTRNLVAELRYLLCDADGGARTSQCLIAAAITPSRLIGSEKFPHGFEIVIFVDHISVRQTPQFGSEKS